MFYDKLCIFFSYVSLLYQYKKNFFYDLFLAFRTLVKGTGS